MNGRGNGLGRFQRESTFEDAERPPEIGHRRIEQVDAPVDCGLHRVMAQG